jgi:hypothetical protein
VAPVVVAEWRRLAGVDPAVVWSTVADPARATEWAPVASATFMGGEVPAVGNTVFVGRGRRSTTPEDAWRYRIVEWDAGHHYACEVTRPRAAGTERLDVEVTGEWDPVAPVTRVELCYRAEVAPLLTVLCRWRIASLLRRALDGIERAVARR